MAARHDEEWYLNIFALYSSGMSQARIARDVGASQSSISLIIAGKRANGQESEASYVAPHKPRVIRAVINRAAIPGATRAFAAGEITRAQLMERIAA